MKVVLCRPSTPGLEAHPLLIIYSDNLLEKKIFFSQKVSIANNFLIGIGLCLFLLVNVGILSMQISWVLSQTLWVHMCFHPICASRRDYGDPESGPWSQVLQNESGLGGEALVESSERLKVSLEKLDWRAEIRLGGQIFCIYQNHLRWVPLCWIM